MAETRDLYDAIESVLAPRGMRLSDQGKASLRNFINILIKKLVDVRPGYGQYRIRVGRFRFRYDFEGQIVYLKLCSLRSEGTYR
jgi:hypothetical protein